uniref:Mannosyltransferase n=1 Tax=Romanomermis culicivorax TaxID=13658 RepID=A0A915JRN8_ROMCU
MSILVLSIIIDRFCYGYWVFSMWNFFLFNFASSGSAHFGTHPIHWFISNGLPTILFMHALPITLGIFKSNVRWILHLSFFYCFVHSLIPHKELRFLLPILPLLNIYCALYMESSSYASAQVKNCRKFFIYYSIMSSKAKAVMYLLLFTNLPLMIYTGIVHQRGVLDVVSYLANLATIKSKNLSDENKFSALILAPCHTTPLFSHLHANISIRFLACEPNLDNLVDYVDEADRFYADPQKWLAYEWDTKNFRPPSHIIMFESLWKKLNTWFAHKKYRRCAKFFNAHFPVSSRQSKYLCVICR